MLDQDFDRLFRDKLLDHSSPVHPGMWKRIRAGWNRRKRGLDWRWLTFLGIGLILLLPVRTIRSRPTIAPTTSTTAAAKPSILDHRPTTGSPALTFTHSPKGSDSYPPTPGTLAYTSITHCTAANHAPAHTPEQAAIMRIIPNHAHLYRRNPHTPHPRLTPPTTPAHPLVPASTKRARAHASLPPLARLSARASITAASPKASSPAAAKPSPQKKPNPKQLRFNRNWHLDFFVAPEFPDNNFNLSWTAGIRATVFLYKRLSLTTGLQYAQRNVNRQDSAMILPGYLIFPPHFYDLDLPLFFGYTRGNEHYTLTVQAGAIFNLYAKASDSTDYLYWGADRMGQSAFLGLDFGYYLTPGLAFFAQPYGRYLFTTGQSAFPSHMFWTGASFGLRYHFKKKNPFKR